MTRNASFKRKTHCVFRLTYHIIFVTKFRRKILTHDILNSLYIIILDFCKSVNVEVVEIKGESDHIHFILDCSPQDTVGSVVGAIKSKSSSVIIRQFGPFFYGKHRNTIWSKGYFVVTTGGVTIDVVKQYIQNQNS